MGKLIEKGITPKTKNICEDFFAIRSQVAKQSWQHMREEGIPWGEAIKKSWDEAKAKCRELGIIV